MTSTHRSPSHPSAPREPEIVRASGVHDLLASVPTLIGIRPEESLVVVPFLGSRAGGGFRIPLPQGPNRAEVAVLARGCAGVMETMPRATAALVVVYTRATYAEARGVPQLELGRAVLRTLERTELGIVAVACVAGDGWGRYTDAAECRQPRPLVEIEGSEAGLFARALAEEPLDLARLAEPPLVDDADRAIVEEVLRRSAHSMPDVVPLVERWLTGSSTPRREAMVVRILQSAPLRDQTTLQIARGAATAEAQRGRRRRLDETSAATGERVSEIAEREFLAGARDAHDVEATALLLGTGPAPDRERLDRATTALARLAALAPREARSAVLTVLAWCWWARGVSSLASVHLEEALALDPGNSMAQLYASLFAARQIPDWVIGAAAESLDAAAQRA